MANQIIKTNGQVKPPKTSQNWQANKTVLLNRKLNRWIKNKNLMLSLLTSPKLFSQVQSLWVRNQRQRRQWSKFWTPMCIKMPLPSIVNLAMMVNKIALSFNLLQRRTKMNPMSKRAYETKTNLKSNQASDWSCPESQLIKSKKNSIQ